MIKTDHSISRSINHLEGSRVLHSLYGYIVDVYTVNEVEYYIPFVSIESSDFSSGNNSWFVPLEDSPDYLSSLYGSPRDLIGLRVRIEYYGEDWQKGVARIVPPRERTPVGNLNEMPACGFRFAVAGGGGV